MFCQNERRFLNRVLQRIGIVLLCVVDLKRFYTKD